MVHASSHPDWSLEDLAATAERISERLAGSREAARDFLAIDVDGDCDADADTRSLRDSLARLTRCRSIAPDGRWSSEEPESPDRAWHRVWAHRAHRYGIVYGHWARQGLHVDDGLRGLDTGCVHHGRGRDGFLTAWLPESRPRSDGRRPFDRPDDRFWHIPARRRYYDPVAENE